MKNILRKTTTALGHVSYQSGDFTNNLLASDIAVEVVGKQVILSFDLSPSQPRGSENSNSYLDAVQLKEEFETLDVVQLHRERWLEEGLRRAAEKVEESPTLVLHFTFKDGSSRSMQATLKVDEHNFWLHRQANVNEARPAG